MVEPCDSFDSTQSQIVRRLVTQSHVSSIHMFSTSKYTRPSISPKYKQKRVVIRIVPHYMRRNSWSWPSRWYVITFDSEWRLHEPRNVFNEFIHRTLDYWTFSSSQRMNSIWHHAVHFACLNDRRLIHRRVCGEVDVPGMERFVACKILRLKGQMNVTSVYGARPPQPPNIEFNLIYSAPWLIRKIQIRYCLQNMQCTVPRIFNDWIGAADYSIVLGRMCRCSEMA